MEQLNWKIESRIIWNSEVYIITAINFPNCSVMHYSSGVMRIIRMDARIKFCCESTQASYVCCLEVGHTTEHSWHDGNNSISWPLENNPEEEKTKNFNGLISTKIAPLELIPKEALESLANRFALGIERKGEGAWNALSKHREDSLTNEFVIESLAHCIAHCYDAIQKVQANTIVGEDDAGAILFAGSVLAVWKKRIKG